MDLIPILYSHKMHNFNISADLRYIMFKTSALCIGDIDNEKIYEIKRDSAPYYSAFAADNSFALIKSDFSCFILSENFQKKTTIRKTYYDDTFGFCKPIVYKNHFFVFCTHFNIKSEGLHIYQYEGIKRNLLFSIKDCYLCDNRIYNDTLHAVMNTCNIGGIELKLYVYKYNLLTQRQELLEHSLGQIKGKNWVVIPQRNLLVTIQNKDNDYYGCSFICFYQMDNFNLLCVKELEKVPIMPLAPVIDDIEVICNGKYVVTSNSRRGLKIFSTEDFSLVKEVSLPGILGLTVCDNDNFCCARSFGDLVVFTPVASNENTELIKRIDNCLSKNGLENLSVND